MLTLEMLVSGLVIGMGATLVLDIWAESLRVVAGVQRTNWCLVGRWFAHMPSGVFAHANVAAAESKRGECAIGWIAHYAIGAFYGLALLVVAPADWLYAPSPGPAVLFGFATIVFPLFVMQPAFGLGIAARNTPSPTPARLKAAVSHTVFGLGLYLSAVVVGRFL